MLAFKKDAREERLAALNVAILLEQTRETVIKTKMQLILVRKQLSDEGVCLNSIGEQLPL